MFVYSKIFHFKQTQSFLLLPLNFTFTTTQWEVVGIHLFKFHDINLTTKVINICIKLFHIYDIIEYRVSLW